MRSALRPLLLVATALAASMLHACHREETYEGHSLDHWYAALRDTSGHVRAQAADIVARAAPEHSETLRRLLDALAAESDSSVHVTLASALGEVVQRSGSTSDVVSSLAALTHDSHMSVRTASLVALSRAIAASDRNLPPPRAALTALEVSLEDTDHDLRIVAAEAIGRIAAVRREWTAPFALPLAKAIQHDRVSYVRQRGLEAFTRVPSPDSLRIATYRSALREDWPDMRKIALRGVALSSPVASVFADSIVQLLQSDDSEIRALTAKALGAATSTSSRPAILAALSRASSDRDSTVRDAARTALARVQGRAP